MTQQASDFVDKFAWGVLDERALKILDHFSPIVEIGAGSGAWSIYSRCYLFRRCALLGDDFRHVLVLNDCMSYHPAT